MELDLDTQTGLKALLYFHNASLKYSDYPAKNTDELLAAYGNKGLIYAEGIGLAINSNRMSTEQVKTAMETLAASAKGRLPKDHNAFMHALQGEAGKVDYLDLTATVAMGTGEVLAGGAQVLGSSLITSLSWLTTLLPFLAIGGAILFVLSYTTTPEMRSSLVTAAKSKLKKAAK